MLGILRIAAQLKASQVVLSSIGFASQSVSQLVIAKNYVSDKVG
jgi:hypothetical protein